MYRAVFTLVPIAPVLLVVAATATAAEHNVPPQGFTALFNGKDLTGWQGLLGRGNPKKILQMAPAERTAAQARADEAMRKHWKVEGGEIINPDGKGTYLCTVEEFGDFELRMDWKIGKGADSGIYLRGVPQVQIWDPVNGIPQAKVGSGGLYNNQKNPSKPLALADKPAGEWNTFRVVMVGENVSIWLNDVLVVNETVMENYWERDKPIYPVGQLQLQTHDGELRFRNVFVRRIPRRPPESGTLAWPKASIPKEQRGNPPIERGVPVGDGWAPPGDNEYGDFELHAWAKADGADASGAIGLRKQTSEDSDTAGYSLGVGPGRWGSLAHGGADGVIGRCPAALAKRAVRDDWNHYYAIARGDHIAVWLNGVRTAEVVHRRGAAKGRIALRAGDGVEFQKVVVREIGATFYTEYRGPANDEGFDSIFNGKDLTGWLGAVNGYAAEDGKLVCKRRGGGNLYTDRVYDNFTLRFEFKLQSGANNGVGIRARYIPQRKEGRKAYDAAYNGMEIQVLENTARGYRYLEPYQYHGSIYNAVPAKRGFQSPIGYWNYEEITARGRRVTIKLNGVTIVDAELKPEMLKKNAGILNQLGYIGFLGHGSRIEFRNIRVKEYDKP